MEFSICRRFTVAVILLSVYQRMVCGGNYVVQVALVKWENPEGATIHHLCCDDSNRHPPNCRFLPNFCETYFQVCLQPYSYSSSNRNCPYSSYTSDYDASHSHSNDISFPFGISLPGDVPNPMTFTIREDAIDGGIRVNVRIYDSDATSQDDLIDNIQFNIRNPVLSNIYTNLSITTTNRYDSTTYTRTMAISYRITCLTGFTGDNCTQSTVNNNSSGCDTSTEASSTDSVTNAGSSDDTALLSLLVINIILTITLPVSIIILMIGIYRKSKPSNDNHQLRSNRITENFHPIQPPPRLQILSPPSPAVSVNSFYRDSYLNGPGNSTTLSIHNGEDGRTPSRQSKSSLFADDYENKLNSNPAYASSPTFNKDDDHEYI